MIEPNRRDSGHPGREHVRRVEAAAQPGLDHRKVDLSLGKPVEGESGRHLEKGRSHFFGGRNPALEKLEDLLLENRLPVDGDALPEINEMRRCVSSDHEPSGAQQRFTGGNDASLAVGAGDMDSRELAVRGAELGEECFGALEAWFDRAGGAGEESLDRLPVGAQVVVHPADAGLPLMWRSSWPTVLLSSERETTESTMPCSSRNSAVWNPSGRSCPIVCLITRGPANPITAPGSARIASPSMAKLALTPPVVGFVRIET